MTIHLFIFFAILCAPRVGCKLAKYCEKYVCLHISETTPTNVTKFLCMLPVAMAFDDVHMFCISVVWMFLYDGANGPQSYTLFRSSPSGGTS